MRPTRTTPVWMLLTGVIVSVIAPNATALIQNDKLSQRTNRAAVINPSGSTTAVSQSIPPVRPDLSTWLREQVRARTAARPEAQRTAVEAARNTARARLEEIAGGNVKLVLRTNGTPAHIKGAMLERRFAGLVNAPVDLAEATARKFLRENHELLLLASPDVELRLAKSEPDPMGEQHLRFDQMHGGLPVWPCELIVHLDTAGNVRSMEGAFIATPNGVPTTPVFSADQALQSARNHLATGSSTENTQPTLIIYGPLDGSPRLAWKFNLTAGITRAWECAVDAMGGTVLAAFSLVHDGAAVGSGVDALGVTRTLNLWQEGATYYMVDTSKLMFNPASTPPNNPIGGILVLDSHNNPARPEFDNTALTSATQVTSAASGSGWLADAVSAAYGFAQTYDYYLQRHNRNSFDGNGTRILGFVRVGVNLKNAFFHGGGANFMVYGDGFPRALDVTGHELTHGVIFNTGNGGVLNYHDQPGALNESFADIFGENVQARTQGNTDWLSGAELAGGAGRNLAQPGTLEWSPGKPYPSKMSEFVSNLGSFDQGGVHINSSIINRCYYLLAAGMNGAIGITNAERIFYRAMTLHLQKESQFIDARHACVDSAEEIFGVGSAQALKTAEAFDAVEILDAPTTPDPTPVPTVVAADSTLFLRWKPSAQAHELWRRETVADGSLGSFVPTVKNLTAKRVSVSGDGSFAAFVTEDNDYGFVNTDGTSPIVANTPGLVHSLAMTPDGQKFAFVLLTAGQPTNEINIVDLVTSATKTIKLYSPDSEGNRLDIVRYADVLDFTSDGRTLIYDAYSESTTAGGAVLRGWTLYALDLVTTNITALYNVNADYDFGNPAVGKTKNHLVTFEVIHRQSGISTVVALDLSSGNLGVIGQFTLPGGTAVPDYSGDDRAIIYSQSDSFVNSGSSLVIQPVAADGITTNGAPAWWLFDADRVSMYRRGSFVSSNALPTITVNSPTNGQIFAAPGFVVIQTVASDPGGGIARVEFFEGSTKLGERTNGFYNLTWTNVPPGRYQITARAIDNLGASKDSSPVAITVATRPALNNAVMLNASTFQLTLTADAGLRYDIQRSTNLVNWSTFTTVSNALGNVTVQDSVVAGQPRRFYRALLR